MAYFRAGGLGNGVHAVPEEGMDAPIWLLGSSDFSARLAAELGLPFAVVSHFAPDFLPEPHPAPWRAAKGGFGFDVLAQIHVPLEFAPPKLFDRLNNVWWFVALLRFRASPYLVVPVVADGAFAKAVNDDEGIVFWPIEVENRLLMIERNATHEITVEVLDWIKRYWWDAGVLMKQSGEFNLLFQACAQCIFARHPSLALLSLWGALEGVFSPAKTELRFRISSNIAAYLEPPGPGRLELQKKVAKLYDARSQAAHGGSDLPADALCDTYALTKRVITKVVDTNHVPTREDLDAALFGA